MQSPKGVTGLYMPETIPPMDASFMQNLGQYHLQEIAGEAAKKMFHGDVEDRVLEDIAAHAVDFAIPAVPIHDNIYTLELFHGPTLAFKDVGARFMAGLFEHFIARERKEVNILVATSGDTGSAVACAFLGKQGIKVTILYPSGKVSKLQEKQLTTLGQNITALEVNGTFDDCQRMAKQAFADSTLKPYVNLTSANSINFARLFPQSFYYFHAFAQLSKITKPLVCCVPSGNFGNITAGLIAKRMGLPVHHFIAATNQNDIIPQYLSSGDFTPKPSVTTISNAMDVGNPSNFSRMQALFNGVYADFKTAITGYAFNDEQTRKIMRQVYQQHDYVLDPHGAIGYGALQHYLQGKDLTGIFLETAHPAKFGDVVEDTLGVEVPMPENLQRYARLEKKSILLENDYDLLRDFLIETSR